MKNKITIVLIALLYSSLAIAQSVAVFDFAANPWKIETATTGDDVETGKIEDNQAITQDGIVMTCQKLHSRYWNRIYNDKLKCYTNNTMTFTAPENVVITKILFKNVKYECDLQEVTQTGGVYTVENEDNDTPYSWTGRAAAVKFKATYTSTFNTIEVTYQPETTTAIKTVTVNKTNKNGVYTLQGIYVGTKDIIPLLPSGIYIVNGKRFIK